MPTKPQGPHENADQPARLDAAQVTIVPPDNVLTLNPGQTFSETIVVTIPPGMPILNVKLVPVGPIAPFVTSINPPAGYGPLTGRQPETLRFEVVFTGPPCTNEVQVFTGALEVVATLPNNGGQVVVAKKSVRITVPECEPAALYSYSVKFVCGVQEDCACACSSVRPGVYATEINIYNPHPTEAAIRKQFVPVVFAGTVVGREPAVVDAKADDKIVLRPRTATMDDCCRIAALLLGGTPEGRLPVTIGFLEIVSNQELAVTAVYTATELKSGSLSIDVEQVRPIRIR